MKTTPLIAAFAVLMSTIPVNSGPAVGQSLMPTLVTPYGARSDGMGEVGTALADDGSAIYFNPAGLDVPNEDFKGGAGSISYRQLMPSFYIPEMWQGAISANFQDSSLWVSPGIFFNRVHMGSAYQFDPLGRLVSRPLDNESVFGIGLGFNFADVGLRNHYFGFTAKYCYAAIAPGFEGSGTGVAQGMAFDLGYLWTIGKYFRFGATLMNMGSSVYYQNPQLRYPIPFTINLGLAYKRHFSCADLPVSVAAEFRLDREIVKSNDNGKPDPFYQAIYTNLLHDNNPNERTFATQMQLVQEHLGGEVTILNILTLRMGYMIDVAGQRYELHTGSGLNIMNHFHLDYAYIHAPDGFMKGFAQDFDPDQLGATGARDGQWQLSLTMDRVFNWKPGDFEWWKGR